MKNKPRGNERLKIFPNLGTICIFVKMITVRIISKKTLRAFGERHKDAEQTLKSWHQETSQAKWKNPNAIKVLYPSASFIGNDRVVFNLRGNCYRLIVKINYDYQAVWIRFIGTHAEYDKINAAQI